MASVRHGMVTRSFDRVSYDIEMIDKTGKVYKAKDQTIITALDDKALKESVGHEAYKNGSLVVAMEIKSREAGLYGQTIEQFIANAIKLK